MSAESAKRPRLSIQHIRDSLLLPENIQQVSNYWTNCAQTNPHSSKALDHIDTTIIRQPFPVCVVRNVFRDPQLLKSVVGELSSVEFIEKNNDLYQFTQTDDVKKLTKYKNISQIYSAVCSEVHKWLSQIFVRDILKKDIAATFSCYQYKDRLLCHDDKCEDRHIAFVIYLTEEWTEEDGGLLQLFDTDSKLYPHKVVESIVPQFNTMVLFEVSPTSFHQVSEVLSKTRKRLSLNGWFHSEGKVLQNCEWSTMSLGKCDANPKELNLEDYFLFNYLEFKNQLDIKSMFISDSEIQLEEFLVPEFWESVNEAWQSKTIKWLETGPANVRKYEMADASSLPEALSTLKDILESRVWFKFLKAITGLDLAASATSDLEVWARGLQPWCCVELRRWRPGSYTLIHDRDPEFHTRALDAILRFPLEPTGEDGAEECPTDEDAPEAGHVIYLDGESKDDECLLHIGYKMNSLALIFRDTKTLKFTKYLDCTSRSFYEVACTYRPWCPPAEQPELRHCLDETDSEPSEGSHCSEDGEEDLDDEDST